MAEVVNRFSKGMQKDKAKNLFNSDEYYHAENFSLTTDSLGLSTATLRNIKGTQQMFDVPGTSNVVEIKILQLKGTYNLVVQGTTFNIQASTTNVSTYKLIADAINNTPNLGVSASYTANHVVLFSKYTNFLPNTPNITCTSSTSNTVLSINVNYVPAKAAGTLKIIGWACIRDIIFLLTTDSNSTRNYTSYGQIWKYTYSKIDNSSDIQLVYNNQLNFSLSHPIPNPGGIEGNYEIDSIQKLYWTDNYNPPRYINTADPNVMALLPSELEWAQDFSSEVPILQEVIQNGNIKTGIYQAGYRLKRSTGNVSKCSLLSNPISIVSRPDNAVKQETIIGDLSTTSTGKSLKFKINQIDSTYDRIEFIISYRKNLTGTPDINIIGELPVPSEGSITFIYSGNEKLIPITLEEYLKLPVVFRRVKTIATKYNYLFPANVTYNSFDLDFDARAYRFDYNRKAFLYNASTPNVIKVDGTKPKNDPTWAVPNDYDCIQDYDMQGPERRDNFIYKADGTTFGGEGVNVSYEFINEDKFFLDTHALRAQQANPYSTLARTNTTFDLKTTYEQYPIVDTYPSHKSPYITGLYRGFQRDEMYRFGIVFYSKKGVPSFVYWIGDIRMPHTYMPDPALSGVQGNRKLKFPLVGFNAPVCMARPMGLKITVNTNSIKDQISGFSIVRVKREQQDKRVLGQGIMYPAFHRRDDVSQPEQNTVWTVPDGFNSWKRNDGAWNSFIGNTVVARDVMSFNAPDFLFGSTPSRQPGDHLDISALLSATDSCYVLKGDNTLWAGDNKRAIKYEAVSTSKPAVSASANPVLPENIHYGKVYPISGDGEVLDTVAVDAPYGSGIFDNDYRGALGFPSTGYTSVKNMSASSAIISPSNGGYQVGSKTLLMRGKFEIWGTYGTYTGGCTTCKSYGDTDYVTGDLTKHGTLIGIDLKLYLANYKRKVSDQYGGNSFQERSLSEYIPCNHYQPVDDKNNNSGTFIFTNEVFGGDTFITLFDNIKQLADTFSNSGSPIFPFDDTACIIRLFPVETTFNTELRAISQFPNAAPMNGWGGTPTGQQNDVSTNEELAYNITYSAENDTQTFFPKPDPFIDNDTYDNRIHNCSTSKINGELIDSWTQYLEDDILDIDNQLGPINNLVSLRNTMYAWQNNGISDISIKERVMIQDASGSNLLLGTGGVLERYDPVSRVIGSKHQFSFTLSNDAIFFFDVNTKNIYKLERTMTGSSPNQLSVVKGMSSFLSDNLNGFIQTNDNPYLNVGVTSTYDFKHNEAWFTFRDIDHTKMSKAKYFGPYYPDKYNVTLYDANTCFSIGSIVYISYFDSNGILQKALGTVYDIPFPRNLIIDAVLPNIVVDQDIYVSCNGFKNFTLAYSDLEVSLGNRDAKTESFSTFYSYTPPVYINDLINIFSPSHDGALEDIRVWKHNAGDYGKFYGIIYPSKVTLLINVDQVVVFENFSMFTRVMDSLNREVENDTFNKVRIYTDSENSDFQDIPIASNGKQIASRKETRWNLSYLRSRVFHNSNPTNIFDPSELSTPNELPFGQAKRLRDKQLFVDLIYNNSSNRMLVLNDFISYVEKSPR